MKKSTFTKIMAAAFAVSVFASPLSAAKKKDGKQKAKTIVIGTGTAYNPFCYLDENGKLTGYEKAVLDAVDELLPQYQFKYETFDFSNILLALNAGKVDIGAHEFEQSEERKKNYLFGEESYNSFITHIIVLKDRKDINNFNDLIGKTVQIDQGDNSAATILKYNETAPADKQIKTFITKSIQPEQRVAGYKGGQFDASFFPLLDMDRLNATYGNIFKSVGEPLNSSFSYFVFRKGDTELQQAVDGALRQLKASGKLSELAIQYLGRDTTKGE